MIFFCLYRSKQVKKMYGTNGTSTELTLDTTEGNLKKEKRLMVDSLLESSLAMMDIYIYSKFESR